MKNLGLLLIGICVGWSATYIYNRFNTPTPPIDVRVDSLEYKFINPLIFSKTSKSFYADEYQVLHNSFNRKINEFIRSGDAKRISVYFRDLNTSHWTGVNEDDTYDPSSLLKVTTLISYLKDFGNRPSILTDKIYYKGSDDSGQYYKTQDKLPVGYHSVSELLDTMIIDSDNTAKQILTDSNREGFQNVYKDFRLPIPLSTEGNDYMSARSYSVVFRALYNSTYLSWDISEKALKLLSLTHFDKGIVAGVAQGTVVAHKFGEHTYVQGQGGIIGSRELHDCGIVYYPQHPYLICIMTQGMEFPKLEKVVSTLSKVAYNYVDSGE